MTRPIILLDDGGVMNDNQIRGEQWPSLVGVFFVPRLGGTHTAWAEANRVVIQRILEAASWARRLLAYADYTSFEREYWLDWLGGMAQHVGAPLPDDDECVELARQAESFVIPQVRSAYPGASATIRQLHTEGYILHTASNSSSLHLAGYLEGMGVRDCFGRLYGADLLNAFKGGPDYYSRLFADLQIEPGAAVIVDDSPRALTCASELGARTVLVGAAQATGGGTLHIGSLAELPALLQQKAYF
jgi:HAD superfamily hydrolase (TIGR01509 family)